MHNESKSRHLCTKQPVMITQLTEYSSLVWYFPFNATP